MELSREKRDLFIRRLRQACIAARGKEHGIATFLGEAVGVSPSTAAKWLNGQVIPDSSRWPLIASELNVSAQWLLGTEHESPPHLRNTDNKARRLIGRAASLVYPLVHRLKPDIKEDELERIVLMAYERLEAGEPENAVSGDVARELLRG